MTLAALFILAGGAVLIVSSRTMHALVAYAVVAATATVLVIPAAGEARFALALLAVSATIKLIVAPAGIWLLLRQKPAIQDLRSSISAPLRLLVAIGFAACAGAMAHVPALASIPMVDVATYIILCSLGMLIVHRNLIAHVVGLLALSAGVTLAGAALAPGLPESIELGTSFDAVVVTFIGLALVRAFLTHNPMLDVDSLRRLRG